ncbi:hypothetical protein FA15DRAFT_667828 [Coprinopsis marcescibilis]|uniref:Uncharacterized protein n=1 Tax=Coprinopsis marcescibilis TaxID=230819 RepID=A0A5C3L0F8_COPMA|nr:hypothetical protein FA15DRAFT_667828 [Coprinopsis marcescibilis]
MAERKWRAISTLSKNAASPFPTFAATTGSSDAISGLYGTGLVPEQTKKFQHSLVSFAIHAGQSCCVLPSRSVSADGTLYDVTPLFREANSRFIVTPLCVMDQRASGLTNKTILRKSMFQNFAEYGGDGQLRSSGDWTIRSRCFLFVLRSFLAEYNALGRWRAMERSTRLLRRILLLNFCLCS